MGSRTCGHGFLDASCAHLDAPIGFLRCCMRVCRTLHQDSSATFSSFPGCLCLRVLPFRRLLPTHCLFLPTGFCLPHTAAHFSHWLLHQFSRITHHTLSYAISFSMVTFCPIQCLHTARRTGSIAFLRHLCVAAFISAVYNTRTMPAFARFFWTCLSCHPFFSPNILFGSLFFAHFQQAYLQFFTQQYCGLRRALSPCAPHFRSLPRFAGSAFSAGSLALRHPEQRTTPVD